MEKRSNHSFKEIAACLLRAESVLIYPHVGIDGDALGSSVALCKALRQKGKKAYILIEEELPLNLRFLDQGYCTQNQEIMSDVDVSVCVDCSETKRFEMRKEKFLKAKTTISIDHHHTGKGFCDYNYIDGEIAATGELIYQLLMEMGIEPDKEIGEAIFAAITTDTGNFQYSNTSKQSFWIMAQLCDWGIDTNRVSVEIYENIRLERKLIENKIMGTMELFCGGKGAVAYVTMDMLEETGAFSDETEGVVQTLRSIQGVEFAAFLKEKEQGLIRISLRAKTKGNVAAIAEALGGGGHIKAAGATLYCSMEEAVATVKKAIEESIKALE